MQERYLFKAKRLDNGEWVFGGLCETQWGSSFIVTNDPNIVPYTIKVDPDTVCQCTGLKDKNGKVIWENDIMEAHLDDKFPEDATRTRVVWDKNAWVTNEPGTVDREYLDEFDTEHFYVIGNVFDNPELLEG